MTSYERRKLERRAARSGDLRLCSAKAVMPRRDSAGLGMGRGELARRARHLAATPIAACLC
jgi:hypothetical protein